MHRILMLSAVTRTNRHAVMPLVNDAVMSLGGWITGHDLYGNMSAVFRFEIEADALPALAEKLDGEAIRLDARSRDAMSESGLGRNEQSCTLNVTFIHNEPDVKRDVPAVPG